MRELIEKEQTQVSPRLVDDSRADLRPDYSVKNFFVNTAFLGLTFAFGSAGAQTIINNGSNNTTNVIVQRAPTVVIENGQAPRQTSVPTATRPPPSSFPYQQPDLLPYMSPRCAQLYEAQLTRGIRRTTYSVRRDVDEEFRLTCPDAVSMAQKALYEDRLKAYNVRQDAVQASRWAAQQSKTNREQCDELLRILAAKRKRVPTMTDGERADHERSETNYRSRCTGA